MKENLTKVQESILVLCTLQALLEEYKECLKKEKDNSKSVIYAIITSQIILTSCSFIEEWELFGNLIKEDSRILELRKIVKPAIDRINKWSDMRYYRNSIVAHNHRIKKENNSIAILKIDRKLKCPNSYFDFMLLMGCIFIIKKILLYIFKNEYNQLIPRLKNIKNIESVNSIEDKETFHSEFNKITKAVQSLTKTIKFSKS